MRIDRLGLLASLVLALFALRPLVAGLASDAPSEAGSKDPTHSSPAPNPGPLLARDPAAPGLSCDLSCHTRPEHHRDEKHHTEACTTCHGTELQLEGERPRVLARSEGTPVRARQRIEGILVKDQQAARLRLKGNPMAQFKGPVPMPERMAYVPAGEFLMGTNLRWEDESPEHALQLHAYFIDLFEVTNRVYEQFVRATAHRRPSHWEDRGHPEGLGDHPVTYVDWNDAQAFCRWAGKRLPSEQEWEKAARGTDGRQYPWGNAFYEDRSNNPQKGSNGTEAVGTYDRGRSPYGLYGMSGNVWEWVDAWYRAHPGNRVPSEEYGAKARVSKGGSWFSCLYYNCGISAPSYNRAFLHQRTRNASLGFRCVKDPEPEKHG